MERHELGVRNSWIGCIATGTVLLFAIPAGAGDSIDVDRCSAAIDPSTGYAIVDCGGQKLGEEPLWWGVKEEYSGRPTLTGGEAGVDPDTGPRTCLAFEKTDECTTWMPPKCKVLLCTKEGCLERPNKKGVRKVKKVRIEGCTDGRRPDYGYYPKPIDFTFHRVRIHSPAKDLDLAIMGGIDVGRKNSGDLAVFNDGDLSLSFEVVTADYYLCDWSDEVVDESDRPIGAWQHFTSGCAFWRSAGDVGKGRRRTGRGRAWFRGFGFTAAIGGGVASVVGSNDEKFAFIFKGGFFLDVSDFVGVEFGAGQATTPSTLVGDSNNDDGGLYYGIRLNTGAIFDWVAALFRGDGAGQFER